MRVPTIFASLTAFALASAPVWADITARTVWDEWKGLLASSEADYTIGSESKLGATLTVRNVSVRAELPDGAGSFTLDVPEFALRDIGRNTVELALTPEAPISVRDLDVGGRVIGFDLVARHVGTLTQTSDQNDRETFAYAGPNFDAIIENLTIDGSAVALDAALTLQDLALAFTTFESAANGRELIEPDITRFNQLQIALEDGLLTASGDLTYDTSATSPRRPDPTPIGTVDLELKGANTLFNQLINAGVIGQGDAMGALLVMGFYARPGSGPDTLVSTIEFSADGSILVNKQQVR